jgi:hypothetical protein
MFVACPVCARRSTYDRDSDRYFHLDGSANAECWCAISRGETVARRVDGQAPAEPEPSRAA